MQIDSIHIKNYRAFKDVTLESMPAFSVLIGANGTGKSTFFDVFSFLKDSIEKNVHTAIEKRGGFNEVVTRGAKTESIEIEIKFRLLIQKKTRLVTYMIKLGQKNSKTIVEREILRYKRGPNGKPFHFLDFANGKGQAVTNEEFYDVKEQDLEREFQELESQSILAIKGLGQFKKFKAASAFRSLIENWHISDFHISDAQKLQDFGTAEHLSATGDNLSQVALHIKDEFPETFSKILKKMSDRVPGVDKVEAEKTLDGRLLLKFKDGTFKDPFMARWVSDGTIKMFAYLVLLHDPSPHSFLCVEEPENQLYPALLPILAEEFMSYSYQKNKDGDTGQVFVTTHSPDFLNAVPWESIFWLVKSCGETKIFRAKDELTLQPWIEDKEVLPGYAWKLGLFGQVDP
jgi:predicted ATPase